MNSSAIKPLDDEKRVETGSSGCHRSPNSMAITSFYLFRTCDEHHFSAIRHFSYRQKKIKMNMYIGVAAPRKENYDGMKRTVDLHIRTHDHRANIWGHFPYGTVVIVGQPIPPMHVLLTCRCRSNGSRRMEANHANRDSLIGHSY